MKTEDSITLEELHKEINKIGNIYLDPTKMAKYLTDEMKVELDNLKKMHIKIGDIIKFKSPRQFDRYTSYGLVKEIHKIQDSLIEEKINGIIYVVELLNSETGMMSRIDVFEKDLIGVYDIK